jgi:hypothetical protein
MASVELTRRELQELVALVEVDMENTIGPGWRGAAGTDRQWLHDLHDKLTVALIEAGKEE